MPGLRTLLAQRLHDMWYGGAAWYRLLLPFSLLFGLGVRIRRWLFRRGTLRSFAPAVPVVVVGNLTVGGTGKTPLVIWLVQRLQEKGLRPGVVSRGYGGRSAREPRHVLSGSDPREVGDEPVLIARRCRCPVVVGRDRVAAAAELARADVDVIISDDGLQHYRLRRHMELAVIDGERGVGNGALLPAGPLREPIGRLASIDALILHGDGECDRSRLACPGQPFRMRSEQQDAVPVRGGRARALESFRGEPVHAVAGIGNPQRFFAQLRARGLDPHTHAHADHAVLTASQVSFGLGEAVLMTEKDAVKCLAFADDRHWYVPLEAQFSRADGERLLALLGKCTGLW